MLQNYTFSNSCLLVNTNRLLFSPLIQAFRVKGKIYHNSKKVWVIIIFISLCAVSVITLCVLPFLVSFINFNKFIKSLCVIRIHIITQNVHETTLSYIYQNYEV